MPMRAIRTVAALAALFAGAPSVAGAPSAASDRTLDVALADTATQLCVGVLSRDLPLPTTPGDAAWHARFGLIEGIPQEGMDKILMGGGTLISGATLMSGEARDGAFAVALGGAAGETCRMLVYRSSSPDGVGARVSAALATPARGWKALPTPPQYAVAGKISMVLRNAGKPYLANLLTPTTPGPVAMAIVVAAVPPHVTLPPGF